MNIQDNSQLTIKKFNLLEKIIHTYECIHKQDALYPALIMSVTCVIVNLTISFLWVRLAYRYWLGTG